VRGPPDDAVDDVADADDPTAASARSAARRVRPRGGKALLRLIELLGRKGLYDEVQTAVTAAVGDDDTARAALDERLRFMNVRLNGNGHTATSERTTESDASPEATPNGSENFAVAIRAAAANMSPPSATGPQWRTLGPWTIPNGQTYGDSRVNVSGRVAAIAVDPSNVAHVLCGSAGGGIWESFDRGDTWEPRTDYATTCTVGALAFDPTNAKTVYCGTGEGNSWFYLGQGVLRSTDGGTTWLPRCTTPFVGTGFYDLVVDSTNATRLVAATTKGLYVSTNGGVGWTLKRAKTCWSIAFGLRPALTPEWLAACSDGVFRSIDHGVTWTPVPLPGAPASWDRLAVAIARSNTAVAYVWGSSAGVPRLYRRAGGIWTAVTAPPGVDTGQAWYDWFLGVSPDNSGQIYCGAIDVHRGSLSGNTWTWVNITTKPSPGQSVHPDQHVIAFEPGQPNTIYIGNDGGVYRSPDRGITYQHCNNGLVISEFEYLAQHPGSARWLIGGTQDNGTQRWTGSQDWEHIADGDGGDCGVNRTDPRTVHHTYYEMNMEVSKASGDFDSWTDISPPLPQGELSSFYPPFECSATTGNTIAIGGDALYVSRTSGTAWKRLAYPSGGRGSAMSIPNESTVYVGLEDGRVLRTTWNGVTWTALSALATPRANAVVSDLLVDPGNMSRIWATYSTVGGGRVFRSDNGGTSWIDRSTSALPALPINAIQVDPADANRAWLAADLGVYQTIDAGASWQNFSNALPNALVGDLLFQPHARVLRAGTRNRGVWEIPVDGWMTEPQCGVQFTGQLAAKASNKWFTWNWPATEHVLWTVMPTTPGANLQLTVQVERATPEFCTYWLNVRNLSSVACSFEGRWCLLSLY
jgi:hypothetical protein